MEWLRTDRLLQEEDLGVFKFLPLSSTILRFHPNSEPAIQSIESHKDWEQWVCDKERACISRNPSGMTLLCCGRVKLRIRGMEAAYLPFPKSLCRRIVTVLQIHGSIARVVNRRTRASFQNLSVKQTNTSPRVLLYNCRSSADWENDLALSVTYTPSSRRTSAVLYGCDDANRDTFHKRLSKCDSTTHHPLTLPMIFAEIERDRVFKKVTRMVTKLVQKAVDISKVSASSSLSMGTNESNSVGSSQPTMGADPAEELMQLWLGVSALQRGLQAWETQLEKMLLHCQRLVFREPVGAGAIDATCSGYVVSGIESVSRQGDEAEALKDCGERIEQRLVELIGEYEEKIRECATIIEGMVLATQLETNNIGQEDARINRTISTYSLGIASSTHSDSKQMRSIAVLTMIFLPATFVASLFSMGFFNWTPEQGQNMVSPHIWLYFVITAAFTCATISVWHVYSKRTVLKGGTDIGKESIRTGTSISGNGILLSPV